CRAVCFFALVKILLRIFRVDYPCGGFCVLLFKLGLLIPNNFSFLFQRFRLGCRSFWRDCGAGPGDKDEVGRVI
ncbi:MAG: hypothetical protein ACK55Z_11180, partial [bacterium]